MSIIQYVQNNHPIFFSITIAIGAIVIMNLVYNIIQTLFKVLFLYNKNLLQRYGKGSWALVTGCTEGIGEAFAYELAKLQFNVILVSRNKEKLQNVEKKILTLNSQIKTKIVIADFSQSAQKNFFDQIYDQIKDLDISLLINNVGIGHGGKLHELKDEQVQEIILVNTFPIVFLTKKLIPKMLARQKLSGIINLGSFLSECPGPYLQTYSATKAFDDFFTRALQVEYGDRIDILSLKPNGVLTTKTSKMNIVGIIKSEDCAKAGLKKLGATNQTSGHWQHCLQRFFMNMLPEFIRIKIMAKVNQDIWVNYNKYLEQEQKEKKEQPKNKKDQ